MTFCPAEEKQHPLKSPMLESAGYARLVANTSHRRALQHVTWMSFVVEVPGIGVKIEWPGFFWGGGE